MKSPMGVESVKRIWRIPISLSAPKIKDKKRWTDFKLILVHLRFDNDMSRDAGVKGLETRASKG